MSTYKLGKTSVAVQISSSLPYRFAWYYNNLYIILCNLVISLEPLTVHTHTHTHATRDHVLSLQRTSAFPKHTLDHSLGRRGAWQAPKNVVLSTEA